MSRGPAPAYDRSPRQRLEPLHGICVTVASAVLFFVLGKGEVGGAAISFIMGHNPRVTCGNLRHQLGVGRGHSADQGVRSGNEQSWAADAVPGGPREAGSLRSPKISQQRQQEGCIETGASLT